MNFSDIRGCLEYAGVPIKHSTEYAKKFMIKGKIVYPINKYGHKLICRRSDCGFEYKTVREEE